MVLNNHCLALDDFTSRHGVWRILDLHLKSERVNEDRGPRLGDTWHQRGLNHLEVVFPLLEAAEVRVHVRQLQSEVVNDSEGVCVDGLRNPRVDILVVFSMFADRNRIGKIAANLELDPQLPGLTWSTEVECLRSNIYWMALLGVACAVILVKIDLRLLGDNETARIAALCVINVDREVGRLPSYEEILRHGHLHVCLNCVEANLLANRYQLVESRIVDNGTHRTVVYALSIAHLALPIKIKEKGWVYGDELRLEEVAELGAEMMVSAFVVE